MKPLETSDYELGPEIKRRVFEKFLDHIKQSGKGVSDGLLDFCRELNPDIIVISGDQTAIFEPQNLRTSRWLYQRFGLGSEKAPHRERVCVHPCQSRKIIGELKAAGFAVAC